MIKPMTQEELHNYFSQFERMGESSVRVAIYSGSWENDRSRLGAASEWLRLKDEACQSRRSRYTLFTASIAAIAAIVAARADIIWIIKYLLNKITKAP
jgi:hypothetical protein